MKILVDSNIVIYSLTKKSPKKKTAQTFLRENQHSLYLSHQVILESIRILTHPNFVHPLSGEQALKRVWRVANVLNLISPNMETIILTRNFISKYKLSSNRIFDAYLVATMVSNGITEIATDNTRHFKIFKGIKVVNPFATVA